MLPLCDASVNQNLPQSMPGRFPILPRYQKVTFEQVNRFMEAIVFTKSTQLIISDENYLMVDQASKLNIDTQNGQQALAGAHVGTTSVSQLPSGLFLRNDVQT